MMNEVKWQEVQQADDMAYFRSDLCLSSPESCTLEEKRDICNEMVSSSKAVLDAMREDFEQLPPEARARLLEALCQSGAETPEWWWDVLVGDGDPLYRELEPSRCPRRHPQTRRRPLVASDKRPHRMYGRVVGRAIRRSCGTRPGSRSVCAPPVAVWSRRQPSRQRA